jgi:hypothetical protein
MDNVKKVGAPKGSQNAKKYDELATSFLHIRVTPADKAKWVKAATGNGGLSSWVIETLNKNS